MLAQHERGLLDVAFRFLERFPALHNGHAGHFAQLFDAVGRNFHDGSKIIAHAAARREIFGNSYRALCGLPFRERLGEAGEYELHCFSGCIIRDYRVRRI